MKPFNEEAPRLNTNLKPGDYILHGDVIIFSEKDSPANFDSMPVVDDSCLAYGEATGHAHKIFGNKEDFELREEPETKIRHLKVVKPVLLKHQEHCPIEIGPGIYRIGIQREYDPFEKRIRKVQD